MDSPNQRHQEQQPELCGGNSQPLQPLRTIRQYTTATTTHLTKFAIPLVDPRSCRCRDNRHHRRTTRNEETKAGYAYPCTDSAIHPTFHPRNILPTIVDLLLQKTPE